jgi:ribonucleoside-diphosphate reductase alpha chain
VLTTGRTEEARQGAGESMEIHPRPRPQVVTGSTRAIRTGCGKLYVTINRDEQGPFELFAQMGKAGGCAASQAEAIARLVSLAFRCGIAPEQVIKQLKGISCHMPAWEPGGERILSCADAVAKAIEHYITPDDDQLAMNFNGKSFGHLGACPECGGTLVQEGGCNVCRDCGYSKCE